MSRKLTVFLSVASALALMLGASFMTTAQPDRIEEDWQVVLGTPDTSTDCPQISATISPTGSDQDPLMVFKLNYRDQPSFQSGGLSAQVWQNKQFQSNSDQGTAQCTTPNETITWTQRMSLSGGNLNFKVLSGNSTTWGQFGANDTDLAVSASSSAADLSGYTPTYSVSNSGATFGANRVTTMTLLQVRYYQGSTLLSTDTTARQVVVAP
jgi:hypothetical protein